MIAKTLRRLNKDTILAEVKYVNMDSHIKILSIYTNPSARRCGEATGLILDIYKINHAIDWGVCTKLGEAFRNSLYRKKIIATSTFHQQQQATTIKAIREIWNKTSSLTLNSPLRSEAINFVFAKDPHVSPPEILLSPQLCALEDRLRSLPTPFPADIIKMQC